MNKYLQINLKNICRVYHWRELTSLSVLAASVAVARTITYQTPELKRDLMMSVMKLEKSGKTNNGFFRLFRFSQK